MDKENNVELGPCRECAIRIMEAEKDTDLNFLINGMGIALAFIFAKNIPFEDQLECINLLVDNIKESLKMVRNDSFFS